MEPKSIIDDRMQTIMIRLDSLFVQFLQMINVLYVTFNSSILKIAKIKKGVAE